MLQGIDNGVVDGVGAAKIVGMDNQQPGAGRVSQLFLHRLARGLAEHERGNKQNKQVNWQELVREKLGHGPPRDAENGNKACGGMLPPEGAGCKARSVSNACVWFP